MDMTEFPQDEAIIYLNHAGIGPWPRRCAEAIARFAEENVRLGARNYPTWSRTEQRLRERLMRLLNAPSVDDIALVKNTSEGLSFVAYGLDWQPGDAVIINRQEFPSNRIVWESLRERFGVEVRDVDLNAAATPEDALIAAMDARVRLLAVSSVQYASGIRMDLERLAAACRQHDILFCLDAIQSLGALRLDVQAFPVDFAIADGHKWMLGPEGLGVFYSRPEARDRLRLMEFGWHMVRHMGDYDRLEWESALTARRFECGSPNMVGIFGLEASLAVLEDVGLDEVQARVLSNARYLMRLVEADSRLELVTPTAPERHAGIVSFRLSGRDVEQVYRQLMERGVVCAKRGGGIRFSPHFYNTQRQLEQALAIALEG
jgi:cysteine desulfurase/selenocysteine lyase